MKNGDTVNPFFCCDLSVRKLNGIKIENHILNVIEVCLGLDM